MRLGLFYRNHYMTPLMYPDGDGGGGDMGGAGGDSGGGDSGGGIGGDGSGAPPITPYDLKDDTASVKIGDKTYSRKQISEFASNNENYVTSTRIMAQIADALRKQRQQPQQAQRPQTQTQQRQQQDVLAALEGMDLVDGKSIAQVLRQVHGTQLEPMAKAMAAIIRKVQTLEGGMGRIHGERRETDFSGDITRAIGGLKLEKADGAEVLDEIARDLFLSYDDADHERLRGGEFDKILKARITSLRKFFRNYEKAELEAAQKRARSKFVRQGGNTSANGKGKLPTNRQMADALFDGRAE